MIKECERCNSNNIKRHLDKTISKPRYEYKCKDCGCIWHYSKQGHAVDLQGNLILKGN